VEPPSEPDTPIDETCNSIDTTYTTHANSSSNRAQRVRFASPCNIPSLGLSTPPHSCERDENHSVTGPENSDSVESQDGITSPKRQKVSPGDVETPSDERDRRSLSAISDISSAVGPENLSDDEAASTADVAVLTTLDSTIAAPRICPQLVDIGQEWEYSKVLGEEVVNGVSYYEVEWCPSLIPKSSVRNIEVLMEYEARKARARACGTKGNQRGRPPALRQDSRAVTGAGMLAR
jgi:hypothetical protein